MDMTHRQKVDRLIEELGQQCVGFLHGRPAAFPAAMGAWPGGPSSLVPRIPQAHPTDGNLFRCSVGWPMGNQYVVVGMARGNPGGYCSPDNGVRGGTRRVSLRANYGLDCASDSSAAGYSIVVGGVFAGLIRPYQIVSKQAEPNSPVRFVHMPSKESPDGTAGDRQSREWGTN
jgi:hypothetical protein